MNIIIFQDNHSGIKSRLMIFTILAMLLPFKNFGQEPAVVRESIETGKRNHNTRIADNPKRKNWIQESVYELREMMRTGVDTQMVIPHITQYEDIREVSYRVVDWGNIKCENGDIIRIVLHSSHTDKEIGDISIAADNRLRVFVNAGHVCGGIVHFETKDVLLPKDVDDFFSRFVSDTDDERWEIYRLTPFISPEKRHPRNVQSGAFLPAGTGRI